MKGMLFTMYEVITGDTARRSKRHEDQDVSAIEQMEWIKHPDVQLDCAVSDIRSVLDKWCKKRRAGPQITTNTQAPNFLDWPPTPEPPLTQVEIHYGTGPVKEMRKQYDWRRTELLKEGRFVLNWQRPAQNWPNLETGSKNETDKSL